MLMSKKEFNEKYKNQSKEFLLEWLYEILAIHYRLQTYINNMSWKSTDMIDREVE